MNMTTVAEGIETADSEQMLKELSCDYGQGYYYSKPIPVAEFKEKFLSENQWWVTMGLHKEDTMIFDSLDRLSLYAKDFPALKTADAILKEDLLSKIIYFLENTIYFTNYLMYLLTFWKNNKIPWNFTFISILSDSLSNYILKDKR